MQKQHIPLGVCCFFDAARVEKVLWTKPLDAISKNFVCSLNWPIQENPRKPSPLSYLPILDDIVI